MINKDMLIYEVLGQKPGCEKIFFEFGMKCLGCPMSRGETIAQACEHHGQNADELVKKLNEFKA